MESSGHEISESADAYSEERRLGDRRRRESEGSLKGHELDAGRTWGNGDRNHAEDARQRDKTRKRSGDGEGHRSSEPESKRRPGPEPDSGIEPRSEDLRLSFESDSSSRSLNYSRRNLEPDGISRRNLESPDSHGHRPLFSPPPPPQQALSPTHRQPEPAHSRQGAKKKRAAPRATISSSQPEQDEPTDLALTGTKRDSTSSQRERSNSGSIREEANIFRKNFAVDGRREAVTSPKGSMASTSDYTSSSTITTSTAIPSALALSHRRAPSPPQGPSSSTSPVSPLPDSSPYSDMPRLSDRDRQHHYQRQLPYREDPSWRTHPEQSPSSMSYSPVQAEESRVKRHVSASSSSPSSPPGSSNRLGEATLLRHLKSSCRVSQESSASRRSSGEVDSDRDRGDAGRESRRISEECRSPTFSPLEASSSSESFFFFLFVLFLSFFFFHRPSLICSLVLDSTLSSPPPPPSPLSYSSAYKKYLHVLLLQ